MTRNAIRYRLKTDLTQASSKLRFRKREQLGNYLSAKSKSRKQVVLRKRQGLPAPSKRLLALLHQQLLQGIAQVDKKR